MSLVLPTDVDGVVTSRALGKAAIWVSSVFLLATFVLVIALRLAIPQATIAVALAGLVLAGLGVAGALLVKNHWGMLALMVVAAAGLYLFTLEVAADVDNSWKSDSVLFSLPKIAMTVVGVAGRSLLGSVVRCAVGFVLASLAVQVAARNRGLEFAFDYPSIITFVGVVVLLLALWIGRRQSQRGARIMQVAAEAEERMIERSRIASRASAALHDTVLNDLHALTLTAPGTLTEAHRAFLARDIAALAHPGLLVDEAMLKVRARGDAVAAAGLSPIIQSARARGVEVAISGDPAILAELDSPAIAQIVKAIDQSLVNVTKHARVAVAELAIVAGVDTINIVVSDAGEGFDPSGVSPYRLGIAVSIKQRIESLGGSVKIWSTPGAGTAVLMSIPRPVFGGVE